jgi:hypothetical protein
MILLELDDNIPLEYQHYDIQLLFPTEFAGLIEVGATVGITLEQIERWREYPSARTSEIVRLAWTRRRGE